MIALSASQELYHVGDTAMIKITNVNADKTVEVPVNFTEVQKPTFPTWEQAAQYTEFIDRIHGDSRDVFVDPSLRVDAKISQNTIDAFNENMNDRVNSHDS